jgi:hypothetical protein
MLQLLKKWSFLGAYFSTENATKSLILKKIKILPEGKPSLRDDPV